MKCPKCNREVKGLKHTDNSAMDLGSWIECEKCGYVISGDMQGWMSVRDGSVTVTPNKKLTSKLYKILEEDEKSK